MADGIGAPILTMAVRLAPLQIRSAASIRSRNLGLCSRELPIRFEPPFDHSGPDPGYIRGYPQGVRENGGQYTHAAVWSAVAAAMLGDGDLAYELFSILNPINHSSKRADIQRYKVEPYVMSADVYFNPQHLGRGGWTWYTGSAGWMYQAGLESILGLRLRGARLLIDPCIPKNWPRFDVIFRYRTATYEISVENPRRANRGVSRIVLDGNDLPTGTGGIPIVDNGINHRVEVTIG
jgi:cyclic beta-1,2-glucan synthetase